MYCLETLRHAIPCTARSGPLASLVKGNASVLTNITIPALPHTHQPIQSWPLAYIVLAVLAGFAAFLVLRPFVSRIVSLFYDIGVEDVYVPMGVGIETAGKAMYRYEGLRRRLRRIYERVLKAAQLRGHRVSESKTIRELLELLGAVDRVGEALEAYEKVMYGRCGRGCLNLARKAEEIGRAVEASSR